MPHELKVNLEILSASIGRRESKFVWLLRVSPALCGINFLRCCGRLLSGCSSDFDLLEEMERQTNVVDTAEGDLRAIFNQLDFKPLLLLPSWDLIRQLSHEHLHHIVALGMNDKRGKVIERRALQVADDKATSILSALLGERVGWRDSETSAHGEAQVSCRAVLLTKLEDSRVEVLPEVDDGILEESIAASRLALSSRSVLFGLLSVTYTSVSHVLTTALLANFEVCVAVELGEVCGGDAAFPVQTVDILTHDELEMVLLGELNHCHVGLRWVRLLNRSSHRALVSGHLWPGASALSSCSLLGCKLLLVRSGLPATWSRLKHSIVSATIVWDSTGG